MIWIVGLVAAYVLMAISQHLTGNPVAFVGIAFFIFCFGMSRYSMYMEQRLDTSHRS